MPSGRWVNVVDYNSARNTYLCLFDVQDVEIHPHMDKLAIWEARSVEFTPEFLLKHCKEKK